MSDPAWAHEEALIEADYILDIISEASTDADTARVRGSATRMLRHWSGIFDEAELVMFIQTFNGIVPEEFRAEDIPQ